MKKLRLPKKLSSLLEMAVNDAQAAKRAGYVLDMRYWQNPNNTSELVGGMSGEQGICTVCLAGSILAQRGGLGRTEGIYGAQELSLFVADHDTFTRLADVENMRRGYDGNSKTYECLRPIREHYDSNLDGGRAPWRFYRQAIRRLRRNGL